MWGSSTGVWGYKYRWGNMWFEGTFKLGQEIEWNRAILTEGDRVWASWSKRIKGGRKGQHVNSECTESIEKTTSMAMRTSQKTQVSSSKWKSILFFFLIAVLDLVQCWSSGLSGNEDRRVNQYKPNLNTTQIVYVIFNIRLWYCILVFGCCGAQCVFALG